MLYKKENISIYKWVEGKSETEIKQMIKDLQLVINSMNLVLIPNFTPEMKKHIFECNKESIQFLEMTLYMKELNDIFRIKTSEV